MEGHFPQPVPSAGQGRCRQNGTEITVCLPVLAYLAAGCSAAFFVVMALKYGNTFLNTVSNTSTGHIQFTLKYFRDLPRSQMSSFCHSLVCALAAGLLSSFVGILLAYYTRRRNIRGMAAAEFAASLPYIIPGTFFGLGYVAAFSHPAVSAAGNPVDHSVKLRVSSDFCGMQGG